MPHPLTQRNHKPEVTRSHKISLLTRSGYIFTKVYHHYLWIIRDVLGTRAYYTNSLHTCVGKFSITGELGQTLHSILERIDGRREVLLEDLILKAEKLQNQ